MTHRTIVPRPSALPRSVALAAALVMVATALGLPMSIRAADSSPAASSQLSAPAITLAPFAEGLEAPVFVTGTGDGSGRLYALEQPGRVRLVLPDGTVEPEPVLDISDRVISGDERGLLGLAVLPDTGGGGRLFVDYTRQPDGATVVSEFPLAGDVADAAAERIILEVGQPFDNHNGGMLAFDQDGRLLVGMGDGGSDGDPLGHAQNPDSLLGKLLRLDVDAAPGTPPEVAALGLRSPWRFSVDRLTGDVWIGDVGQDRWEEVDLLPVGSGLMDFGWNEVEGPECFHEGCDPGAHAPPVASYGHDQGCAITGGYAYRGARFPEMAGRYLFGDACSGTVWWLDSALAVAGGSAPAEVVGRLDGELVSFGEDDAGELYVVDLGGRILRLDGVSGVGPAASPSSSPEPAQEPPDEPRRGFAPNRVKLRIDKIADGLAAPVYLTGDGTGSGRLYIVERAGTIRVMEKGKVRGKPLLDIRGRVGTDGERGLHAVAFHPRFARNGRFYVHYNDVGGTTHVVEYRTDGRASPVAAGSGREVLTQAQPEWNHNGGWIGFGPDGFLYIALGDGGGNSPGDPDRYGQRHGSKLAKILRIDVDGPGRYGIPRSNPYAKGEKGFARETWAWGLRNPWRASFDRQTGDLWIGDVGQDRYEEVDLAPARKGGLNFGWSDMEGRACHHRRDCDPRDYRLPVAVYSHAAGCSITGGYVYRGERYPDLYGAYLYADYCTGAVWGLDADAVRKGRKARPRKLLDAPWNWVSFGEDDKGELYIVSLGGGIYRLKAVSRR